MLFEPATMFPVAAALRPAEGASIGEVSAYSLAFIFAGSSNPGPRRSWAM
jgi:hypothetical protein